MRAKKIMAGIKNTSKTKTSKKKTRKNTDKDLKKKNQEKIIPLQCKRFQSLVAL
jgi:hypothetical protein